MPGDPYQSCLQEQPRSPLVAGLLFLHSRLSQAYVVEAHVLLAQILLQMWVWKAEA